MLLDTFLMYMVAQHSARYHLEVSVPKIFIESVLCWMQISQFWCTIHTMAICTFSGAIYFCIFGYGWISRLLLITPKLHTTYLTYCSNSYMYLV